MYKSSSGSEIGTIHIHITKMPTITLVIFLWGFVVSKCTIWKFAGEPVTTTLGDRTFIEMQTGPADGYVSLHEMGVEVDGRHVGSLTFQVKAAREVQLALLQDAGDTQMHVYELTLGGWANTLSVIRKAVKNGRIFTQHRHRPLSSDEFRGFWVSWGQGRVTVGTGLKVGSEEFMTYRDPFPHDVKYVSVKTSWGAIGTWRFHVPSEAVGLTTGSAFRSLKYRGYDLENRTSISFLVKASTDVNVVLSKHTFSYRDMYWLSIGSRRNSWSSIRKGRMGPDRAHAVHTPLSADNYMQFWVWWGEGLVRVGEGVEIGCRQFLSWKDQDHFDVQQIYLSTSRKSIGHWIFNLKDGETIPLPPMAGGLHLLKN